MAAGASKLTASADRKSTKADTIHKGGQRQRVDAAAFGARLSAAISEKGLRNTDVAERSGLSRQIISEYANGQKVAGADNLFAIADALGVYARWLLRGEGPQAANLPTDDMVQLPRYDLFEFGEHGKPAPSETVPLPAAWLRAAVKTTTALWLAEMPSDAMPSLAREGELLVCRDPEPQLQDRRVYIFLLDGRPLVRRAFVRPEGLQLRSEDDSDTIVIAPQNLEQVIPVGRVLSAIAIHNA